MSTLLQDILAGGDLTMVIIVAILAIGGLLVERALLASGLRAYFRLGLPLGEELVPIPFEPQGQGRTASVRWKVDPDASWVRFWSQPGDRSAPMGLHGVIGLVRGPRGVHLPVRWSPPLTPFAALGWFIVLGGFQGMIHVTLPVGLVLMAALVLLYRQAALRAARELRWSFVSGEEGPSSE